jgi:hypothetical protein
MTSRRRAEPPSSRAMRSRSSDNAGLFEDMAMPVALISDFCYVLFLFSSERGNRLVGAGR